MKLPARSILSANLKTLMDHHDLANSYRAATFFANRGCKVSQRTLAYLLDPADRRAVTLATLEAIATGFGVQPWQLLVPRLSASRPPQLIADQKRMAAIERVAEAAKDLASLEKP